MADSSLHTEPPLRPAVGFFRQLPRSLAVRLSLWFALVFTFSASALFLSLYWFLANTLEEREQRVLFTRLDVYVNVYERSGLPALRQAVRRDGAASDQTSLFVRVINQRDNVTFAQVPDDWVELRRVQVPVMGGQAAWEGNVEVVRIPRDARRDFAFASRPLSDGAILQIGRSTDNRQVLLEPLRKTFLTACPILVLVGFAGGAVFAYRATYPLRQIVATARDITNTGHLDARVAKPSGDDELTDLVNLFNSMLEKNQGLIRAMRESLDNTAHDLRTPLTRLRITAETGLQSEASQDQCREALADCVEESERVLKILNTLLDVTEAEAGMMQLHLEPLQMSQLLGEVIEIYEFVADEKQIDVKAELDPNCVVRGDPQRLRQVFANLLDNALKYTSSGGQIIVRATCEPGGAVVRIRDTGQGIDLDEQPKIWTRLYRGDKSRSQRGLGLGLSLVKAIVEAHQGRVSVDSRPGEGSEFVVQFPAAVTVLNSEN